MKEWWFQEKEDLSIFFFFFWNIEDWGMERLEEQESGTRDFWKFLAAQLGYSQHSLKGLTTLLV